MTFHPPSPGGRVLPFNSKGCDSGESSEIFYFYRLNLICKFKSKHARIKIHLAVERTLYVFRATKSVLLAFECNVGDGQTFLAQRLDHHLSLIGRYNFVFQALKENHRARQALGEMNRRARN